MARAGRRGRSSHRRCLSGELIDSAASAVVAVNDTESTEALALAKPSTLRRVLDGLYLMSGVIAALFLIAMLLLILTQMVARWTGAIFPGAPDYAGYCMAAASFFAFAYTLNHAAHIRVNLFLNSMGASARNRMELWCLAVGSIVSCYLAWYAIRAVRWSIKFGDVSQGQDATPLWIPQMSMVIGSVLLAVAFIDNFVVRWRSRRDHIRSRSDDLSVDPT